MKKKILSLTLVVCLLAIAVVGGTLAYFTDTNNVATNTFTVGNVEIVLNETDVDVYGVKDGETRVAENTYKLIPGHPYVKDPMVTVEKTSEECYVRMFVTIDKAVVDLLGNLPEKYVEGWDREYWKSTAPIEEVKKGDAVVAYRYEFRHDVKVDARENAVVLKPLFTSFTVPGELTEEEVATLNNAKIVVTAEAIQADGFADADAAFTALNGVLADA